MPNTILLFNADDVADGYTSTEFIYFKLNDENTIYDRKSTFTITTDETAEEISVFYNGTSKGNYSYAEYYKNKAATEIMGSTLDLAIASILDILS